MRLNQQRASVTSAPTSPPPTDAERRQLTVMFCDLVGSTALSSRLDPEDPREVIAAYHRAFVDVVRGFDGFVAKHMGGDVLCKGIREGTDASGAAECHWRHQHCKAEMSSRA